MKKLAKRDSFSLLEVLISLPLVGLLATSLLGNFTTLLTLNQKQKEASLALLEVHYFKHRLKKMIFSCDPQRRDPILLDHGIEFRYDNGVNLDPKASNQVVAALQWEKDQLKLRVYKERASQKERLLLREEVLLSQIEKVEFNWGYCHEREINYQTELKEDLMPTALKVLISTFNPQSKKQLTKDYLFEW